MKKQQWLTLWFLVLLVLGLVACADSTDSENGGDDLPSVPLTQPVNGDGRGNSATPEAGPQGGTALPGDDSTEGGDDNGADDDLDDGMVATPES